MKRVLSVILPLVVATVLMLTVYAASEPEITISGAEVTLYDEAKTVEIVLNTPVSYSIEGVWKTTATGNTNQIKLSGLKGSFGTGGISNLNALNGEVIWIDNTFQNPQSGNLLTATYFIPSDTPTGTYTVNFTLRVFTGTDFEPVESNEVYTATIEVTKHSCVDANTDSDHLCDDPNCSKQVGSHSYGSWQFDEDSHWRVCNCLDRQEAAHDFTHGDCICGAEKPSMTGDFDGDGEVTAEDLTMLARHVAGIEKLTGIALASADVNSDGAIDSSDLTDHARYVAGIIKEWP